MPYRHELIRTPEPPKPLRLASIDVATASHLPVRLTTRTLNAHGLTDHTLPLSPAEARELASALVTAANDVTEHPDNAPLTDEPAPPAGPPCACGHQAAPREHDAEPVTREFPGFGERPQDVDETHDDRLARVIHEALGAASVAWTGTPRGTFDATYARSIVAHLLAEVHRYASSTAHRHQPAGPPHEFPAVPTLPGTYTDQHGDQIKIHDDGSVTGWITAVHDLPSSYNIRERDTRATLDDYTPYTRTE